jgi:hypothetical protein
MAVVAVIIAAFFVAIIIVTRQAARASSQGDVVLILVVGLKQIKFREIIDVAAFDLVREAMMLHSALIDGRAE